MNLYCIEIFKIPLTVWLRIIISISWMTLFDGPHCGVPKQASICCMKFQRNQTEAKWRGSRGIWGRSFWSAARGGGYRGRLQSSHQQECLKQKTQKGSPPKISFQTIYLRDIVKPARGGGWTLLGWGHILLEGKQNNGPRKNPMQNRGEMIPLNIAKMRWIDSFTLSRIDTLR